VPPESTSSSWAPRMRECRTTGIMNGIQLPGKEVVPHFQSDKLIRDGAVRS
jgi:hypothetical protein